MQSQGILRKTMLAGLGIYSLTKEKAQAMMDDLVQRGDLSKDEGAKFVKAMLEKADEEVTFLKKMIDERINKASAKFRLPYEEEFKKLNQKIDKLSKQVENISKKV